MEKVTNLAPSMKVMPALCLDWDGTIRRSKSGQTFIQNHNDIELIPNMEEIIWQYRNNGFLVLGISNQAGVAHGFKLPMEIELERDKTLSLFKNNPFHMVKMCYHDAKGNIGPYNHRSLLRKPQIGMLALCEAEAWPHGYVIDWDKSIFVGDRPEDELCANNALVKFILADDFLTMSHVFE